jgi:hypothetical protein
MTWPVAAFELLVVATFARLVARGSVRPRAAVLWLLWIAAEFWRATGDGPLTTGRITGTWIPG